MNPKQKKSICFAFIIFLLIMPASCGYRFTGQGILPGNIKSIHIAIFENKSSEIAIEHMFANDLSTEFIKNGIKVTTRDKADAVLTGTINAMKISTISRKDSITSLEREITAVVSTKLTDSSGNILWSGSDISEDEAYGVLAEKAGTDYGKKAAVQSVSKRIAEEIYNRLTQEF